MSGEHLNPELWDFVRDHLPTPPARVLDVGCGAGESTRELAAAGFEAVGVDPVAPGEPGFIRGRLEDFEADRPFDAALAIRSLHHLDEPELAIARLRRALAEGAPLVLFEFDVEAVDDAARAWVAERGLAAPIGADHVHEVLSLAALRELLAERFRLVEEAPEPYMAREAGRPELEAEEREAIVAGRLRPSGARLVYEAR